MPVNAYTLQINLSAGDSAYAEWTVPALISAHPDAAERLLIIDACKPQRTHIVDPAARFPEPAYSARQEKIQALAEHWRAAGLVDRVEVLRPGDALFAQLRQRYLRPWVRETHDYGGCALLAYLAAFELCRTRWLVHYDADMLLHQAPGFSWTEAAIDAAHADSAIIAATPRPAPPCPGATDAPSSHERLTMHERPAGWLSHWFSTRCYLFDVEGLRPLLPLLQGRVYWESVLARLRGRGYPRSPEIMLFRRLSAARRWRLTLNDRRAWLLHPVRKDAAFVTALPALLAAITAGTCPDGQRGRQDLDLTQWNETLR
jgi:hypothetical protein